MAFDLNRFYAEVDRVYAEGHQSEVLGYLERELEAARIAGDATAFVAVGSELGGVLRARGELVAAEKLYLEVLSRMSAASTLDSMSVAHVLINLGDVYVAADKRKPALIVFDAAEKIVGTAAAHPYEVSAICNNRSTVYRQLGDYDRAKAEIARASELLQKVPHSEGRLATNAVNLAQILIAEGKLQEAQTVLTPALKAYEHLSGGRDIHRPQALWTQAQIYKLQGHYVEARDACKYALELLEDKLGASEQSDKLRAEVEQLEVLAGH